MIYVTCELRLVIKYLIINFPSSFENKNMLEIEVLSYDTFTIVSAAPNYIYRINYRIVINIIYSNFQNLLYLQNKQ